LAALRKQGWRKIVAGGQSRGGWTSLQVLNVAGLADAVIAVSPAFFGGYTNSDNTAGLYRYLHAVKSPATRVAIVQFTEDKYVTDMDLRVALYRDALPPRVAALLIIDRPAGITGHGGGATAAFAQGYSNCLLRFVTDPAPPSSCPAPAP
jgi:dienelactone hydrolase